MDPWGFSDRGDAELTRGKLEVICADSPSRGRYCMPDALSCQACPALMLDASSHAFEISLNAWGTCFPPWFDRTGGVAISLDEAGPPRPNGLQNPRVGRRARDTAPRVRARTSSSVRDRRKDPRRRLLIQQAELRAWSFSAPTSPIRTLFRQAGPRLAALRSVACDLFRSSHDLCLWLRLRTK